MTYFIFIFSVWIHSLSLCQGDSNNPSINMIARYSSQNLILVCDVKSEEPISSNIYLNCPFMVGHLCYSNCVSICTSRKNCLPMISSCSIERIKENYYRLKWSIDVTIIKKSGEWKCSHRNIISNPISIERYNHNSNITYVTKETTKNLPKLVQTTTLENLIRSPLQTDIESQIEQNENFNYYQTGYSFWQFITRPNIVLILVCVFTASLILNIIFVIRCALIRSVITNILQEKKSPNSCLFKCLSIPVNKKLPIGQALTQAKPSAYFGYRRDEVYDDMSSGLYTERHHINNYSHYELEHDTSLSRKIYSDKNHDSINRQSQLFSGPGIGNYVIVTGPVRKIKNPMSLNTLSNTSATNISQNTYITDTIGKSPSNEFQSQEYSTTVPENKIYSQPLKNRKKCYDEESFNSISTSILTSPPVLPKRYSFEQGHNTISNLVTEPISITNVDLIQHYTQTLESPEKTYTMP